MKTSPTIIFLILFAFSRQTCVYPKARKAVEIFEQNFAEGPGLSSIHQFVDCDQKFEYISLSVQFINQICSFSYRSSTDIQVNSNQLEVHRDCQSNKELKEEIKKSGKVPQRYSVSFLENTGVKDMCFFIECGLELEKSIKANLGIDSQGSMSTCEVCLNSFEFKTLVNLNGKYCLVKGFIDQDGTIVTDSSKDEACSQVNSLELNRESDLLKKFMSNFDKVDLNSDEMTKDEKMVSSKVEYKAEQTFAKNPVEKFTDFESQFNEQILPKKSEEFKKPPLIQRTNTLKRPPTFESDINEDRPKKFQRTNPPRRPRRQEIKSDVNLEDFMKSMKEFTESKYKSTQKALEDNLRREQEENAKHQQTEPSLQEVIDNSIQFTKDKYEATQKILEENQRREQEEKERAHKNQQTLEQAIDEKLELTKAKSMISEKELEKNRQSENQPKLMEVQKLKRQNDEELHNLYAKIDLTQSLPSLKKSDLRKAAMGRIPHGIGMSDLAEFDKSTSNLDEELPETPRLLRTRSTHPNYGRQSDSLEEEEEIELPQLHRTRSTHPVYGRQPKINDSGSSKESSDKDVELFDLSKFGQPQDVQSGSSRNIETSPSKFTPFNVLTNNFVGPKKEEETDNDIFDDSFSFKNFDGGPKFIQLNESDFIDDDLSSQKSQPHFNDLTGSATLNPPQKGKTEILPKKIKPFKVSQKKTSVDPNKELKNESQKFEKRFSFGNVDDLTNIWDDEDSKILGESSSKIVQPNLIDLKSSATFNPTQKKTTEVGTPKFGSIIKNKKLTTLLDDLPISQSIIVDKPANISEDIKLLKEKLQAKEKAGRNILTQSAPVNPTQEKTTEVGTPKFGSIRKNKKLTTSLDDIPLSQSIVFDEPTEISKSINQFQQTPQTKERTDRNILTQSATFRPLASLFDKEKDNLTKSAHLGSPDSQKKSFAGPKENVYIKRTPPVMTFQENFTSPKLIINKEEPQGSGIKLQRYNEFETPLRDKIHYKITTEKDGFTFEDDLGNKEDSNVPEKPRVLKYQDALRVSQRATDQERSERDDFEDFGDIDLTASLDDLNIKNKRAPKPRIKYPKVFSDDNPLARSVQLTKKPTEQHAEKKHKDDENVEYHRGFDDLDELEEEVTSPTPLTKKESEKIDLPDDDLSSSLHNYMESPFEEDESTNIFKGFDFHNGGNSDRYSSLSDSLHAPSIETEDFGFRTFI